MLPNDAVILSQYSYEVMENILTILKLNSFFLYTMT